MTIDSERRKVLEMIENGKLNASEGLLLWEALSGNESQDDQQTESIPLETTSEVDNPIVLPRIPRRLWQIPLWVGVTLVVLSALAMLQAIQKSGLGGWFIAAWVPFLAGILLIILAWESQTAHWFHLRVRQKPGEWPENFSISIPLPFNLLKWILRVFGNRIPQLRNTSIETLIEALETQATPENPIYIDVKKSENGEQVQLVIA